MPDDFLEKVSALAEKTDTIIPRVLEAGGKIMLAKVRENLTAVVGRKTKHKSRSTGELARALGVSGARLDRNGNYDVKVGFAESRRGGESNAKIANIIEHGKHGQPAKPFLKPARSAAKDEVITVMKNKLEEEINRI
jgi:HK97 gp10 family phage protein